MRQWFFKYKIFNVFCLGLILFFCFSFSTDSPIFLVKKSKVHFKSDAPLELIEATSTALKGAIDISY